MSNHITGKRIIAVSRKDDRLNKFLQGGIMDSFSVPPSVLAIAPHAFDNIDGLTDIIFTNPTFVVEVSPDSGIPATAKFTVPNNLVAAYAAKYPNRTIEGYVGTPPAINDVPFELIGLGDRFTISSEIYCKDLGDGRYELLPTNTRVTDLGDGRYIINQ